MNVTKFIAASFACILAVAACKKEVTPTVSIDETVIEAPANGSTELRNFTSNVTLTPVSSDNWIVSSIENGSLRIFVEENFGDAREGSVSLVYLDKTVSSITVKQGKGSTIEISEVEAFYYGSIEDYGAGTQNWMISFYTQDYLDSIESDASFVFTVDLMASQEFTFVSGKFPTGEFKLSTKPEVGAVYNVNSHVMDGNTYESTEFFDATLTIRETEVENEFEFLFKCKDANKVNYKFYFKAVCGGNGYDLRKYDTRVESTITKDYDITFNAIEAYLYENDSNSSDLELTLTQGKPAMGISTGDDCFTDAMISLYTPVSNDISGTYELDFDFTFAPYTIFYFSRYWWFSGVYPDPDDPTWYRPLKDGNLNPSAGSITLKKQDDGSYKIDGSFVDDYTSDYPTTHTVTFHGQFTISE